MFKVGQAIEDVPVWLGKSETVQMVAAQDIVVTIPRRLRPQLAARVAFDSPVPAPVQRGQQVGTLIIAVPERPAMTFPLNAEADVEKLGYTGRIFAGLSHLLLSRK